MDTESLFHMWGARLQSWGLLPLAQTGLEVLQPLSPFAAQALYVLQPTLGLFLDGHQVGAWAAALEDPQTVANWRAMLDEVSDE